MQCLGVVGGAVAVTSRDVESGSCAVLVADLFLEGGAWVEDRHASPSPRRRRAEDPGDGKPDIPPSLAGYPNLWAFLAYSQWAPGQERVPGSVTLFRDAGRLKAAFNDRDSSEVGFATLEDVEGILAQLERCLLEDRIDWRRSGPRSSRR